MSSSRIRCGLVVTALALAAGSSMADDPIRLAEGFPAGYQYRVRTRVNLTGTFTPASQAGQPPPKHLDVKGDSVIDYDERVLDTASGEVKKTARIVRRMEFHRTVGDRPQEASLRPAVSRLVLLRRGNTEVPFSPDGPLTWGEIDLVRTDVFTPALAGLLPDRAVVPGDRWDAATSAIQELTDMEKIDEGKVECRLEQVTTLERRRHARVAFRGAVRGLAEGDPVRQELDGYFFFDLESHHLSYLYLDGRNSLLDKDGKEVGQVKGRFVLSRQVVNKVTELSDEALRGLALEPNADNTLLLYENPDLGVRFLHPRRWRVVLVKGSQITLDGADGSGLLITLSSMRDTPTAEAFLTESRDWLTKQKAKLLRTEPPQQVQEAPQALDRFALESEMGGQRFFMDYWVARQATGGATLAARLLPDDLATLRKEIERVARSLIITKALK